MEEVRDDLLDALASSEATIQMEKAMEAAFQQVDEHFRNRLRESGGASAEEESSGLKDPEIDVEALAEKHGLSPGEVPLSDIFAIQDTDLGKATEFDASSGSFREVTFIEKGFLPEIPLYKPGRIGAQFGDKKYIFWKTAQTEEREPEFDEVKVEVEQAWKMIRARELAQTHADELAAKVEPDKSIGEALSEDEAENVVETGEFSWYSRGMLPFGGGNQLRLSDVEGVHVAGEDFMKAVFQLNPGQTTVAFNNPKDEVYVVRVIGQNPVEARQELFLQSGMLSSPSQPQELRAADFQQAYRRWIAQLEKDLNVTWVTTEAMQDRF